MIFLKIIILIASLISVSLQLYQRHSIKKEKKRRDDFEWNFNKDGSFKPDELLNQTGKELKEKYKKYLEDLKVH